MSPAPAPTTVESAQLNRGPTNVKIRSGESTEATSVSSPAEALKAVGGTAKEGFAPRAGDTTAFGSAVETPGFRPSTEEEVRAKTAMPSLSSIAVPGVVDGLEATDPYAAAKAYKEYAGVLLKRTQEHDTIIETRARLTAADHVRLTKLKLQYEALTAAGGDPKKIEKKKKDLEDEAGAEALPPGFERADVFGVVLALAEKRMAVADLARKAADEDVPLVDGVYTMAEDDLKAIKDMTGGRPVKHTEDRLAEKKKKAGPEDEEVRKHQRRLGMMAGATGRAQKLGGSVRQAYLSESRLKVKRKELLVHERTIKAALPTADKVYGVLKPITKKAASAAVGFGTAGVVSLEDRGADQDSITGVKPLMMWQRIGAEFDKAHELVKKKPYGAATSFHAGLQVLNGVLREVRNLVAGIGTLVTILAAVTGPAGAAALGPVGIILGLVALAITMFKAALETVLATWSALTRAFSSNARHHNLLTTQARGQAAEALVDTASAALTIGMPVATNEAVKGDHLKELNRPDKMVADPGSILAQKPPPTGSPELYLTARQTAMGTGLPVAANIGVGVVSAKGIEDGVAGQRAEHQKIARPRTSAFLPANAPDPDSEEGLRARAAATPHQEPAWIKEVRKGESETRDAAIDNLLKKHSRQIGQFHDRTQNLMNLTKQQSTDAQAASKVVAKAPTKDENGALDTATSMSAKTREITGALSAEMPGLSDPKKLNALLVAELSGKLAERGGPKG